MAPLRNKARDSALEKFNAEVVAAMHTPDEKRTALQKQICYQAAKYTASKEQTAADGLKGEQKKRYDALKVELATVPIHLGLAAAADRAGRVVDAEQRSRRRRFACKGEISGRPGRATLSRAFRSFSSAPRRQRSRSQTATSNTTGRRTALAKWLTRPDNPIDGPRAGQSTLAGALWPRDCGHAERFRGAAGSEKAGIAS